jgi:hypothetical protein
MWRPTACVCKFLPGDFLQGADAYWGEFRVRGQMNFDLTVAERGSPNMNNIADSDPSDLIDQATAIIMDRFGLEAVQALEVLRKISQHTRNQICVVAEQVINHQVPVAAMRGLEEAMRGFG